MDIFCGAFKSSYKCVVPVVPVVLVVLVVDLPGIFCGAFITSYKVNLAGADAHGAGDD